MKVQKIAGNLAMLKDALLKAKLRILNEKDNVIEIAAGGGVYVTEIRKRRVIKLPEGLDEYFDPEKYGFQASKAKKGLKINLKPKSNKKKGTLRKSPSSLRF